MILCSCSSQLPFFTVSISPFSSCSLLLREVRDELVTEELLEERLLEHVDARDAEMEEESQHETGGQKETATKFYIGGIETEQTDFKQVWGENFSLTLW